MTDRLLAAARRQIDALDAEIVRLVDRRALLAKEIAEAKARAGVPLVDAAREDAIAARAGEAARVIPRGAAAALLRAVIAACRSSITDG